jgi:hypothetical protein
VSFKNDVAMLERLRDDHERGHDAVVWSPEAVKLLADEAAMADRAIAVLLPLASLSAEQIAYLVQEVTWMAEAHVFAAPLPRTLAFVALASALAKVKP